MTPNTGGPAFPAQVKFFDEPTTGMTLRDYFAAKAMQSLIVETGRALQHLDGVDFTGLNIVDNEGGTPLAIAEESYLMADAMLKAREA
jgi:hypothetical protein